MKLLKERLAITGEIFAKLHALRLIKIQLQNPKAYSEPYQTSRMERFTKIVNSF